MNSALENTLAGCLIGTSIGDALGLPAEGLTRERQARFFPDLDRYHFFFGKGMISDDSEHTFMLAQSLISSRRTPEELQQRFSWKLRFWLLGMPAGLGATTLKACFRLWLGIPPSRSGVFSAGNTPAMRSAILGIIYGHDLDTLRKYVRVSTRVTHTDPAAEYGAMAVALAASLGARYQRVDPEQYYQYLKQACRNDDSDFIVLMRKTTRSVQNKESLREFLLRLGCGEGISGYIQHTVPAVIHIWLTHQDNFRLALLETIHAGGDTDTTAAIMGAIMGARVGYEELPRDWVDNLMEWPRSVSWQLELAKRLAESLDADEMGKELPISIPGLIVRNMFFLVWVILHGFRRYLPPY